MYFAFYNIGRKGRSRGFVSSRSFPGVVLELVLNTWWSCRRQLIGVTCECNSCSLNEQEMTLEEYEKLLEEKRQALQALKTEERKVDTKEFESMQQLSKKSSDDIFIKLVKFLRHYVLYSCLMLVIFKASLEILLCHDFQAPKDKRRESAEKEEKAKKVLIRHMRSFLTLV